LDRIIITIKRKPLHSCSRRSKNKGVKIWEVEWTQRIECFIHASCYHAEIAFLKIISAKLMPLKRLKHTIITLNLELNYSNSFSPKKSSSISNSLYKGNRKELLSYSTSYRFLSIVKISAFLDFWTSDSILFINSPSLYSLINSIREIKYY